MAGNSDNGTTTDARPDPLVGRVLAGRYDILRLLGQGGMGKVYEGRQRALDRPVAVKCIHRHFLTTEQLVVRFLEEARVASQLVHPNIVKIYDFGRTDGPEQPTFFLVMELLNGPQLGGVIQKEAPLALPRVYSIIVQILSALGEAHAHGVTHRDAKPDNIVLEPVGGRGERVKIIDFGVAKAAGKLSQTTAGQIKGKHAYMSPEQAKGEPLDHRSDVFGLGTVFYELLTNTRLFKRESEIATLKAVVGAKIIPPSEVVPGIPKALDAVVLKALARNRDERFATAGDMQLAIDDFLFKQQEPGTTARLAAFMREIYAEELEEEFSTEPTIIAYDPRLPARKPVPIADASAPTALVPVHKEKVPPPEVPAAATTPAPKAPGASPIPKAPKVVPAPKPPSDSGSRDAVAKKTSRSGGKGDK